MSLRWIVIFNSLFFFVWFNFRHCWECLGEAYMSRGSYNAAMKAFSKAAEVSTSLCFIFWICSVFCLLSCYFRLRSQYKLVLLRGWPFITRERDGPDDFQTDPPLHPSFSEMTPHTFYILWKWPRPIAVETKNFIAANRAEVHYNL